MVSNCFWFPSWEGLGVCETHKRMYTNTPPSPSLEGRLSILETLRFALSDKEYCLSSRTERSVVKDLVDILVGVFEILRFALTSCWGLCPKNDKFKKDLLRSLYHQVKEHHRKGLFRSGDAKDIKKIPTQPGWIELGITWEWMGKTSLHPCLFNTNRCSRSSRRKLRKSVVSVPCILRRTCAPSCISSSIARTLPSCGCYF